MKHRVILSKVASVSHLIYAGAYINKMLDADGVDELEVYCLGFVEFLGSTRVVWSDFRKFIPQHPKISVYYIDSGSKFPKFISSYRITYLCVDTLGLKDLLLIYSKNPTVKLDCIIFDEGLGSYMTTQMRFKRFRKASGSVVWAALKIIKENVLNILFRPKFWRMYYQEQDGWKVNKSIEAWIKQGVPLHNGNIVGKNSRVIYYISQPVIELGIVAEQKYYDFLLRLQQIIKKYNYHLIVKPHPLESKHRYKGLQIEIDSISYPAELRSDIKNSVVILGINSTGLINFSALYGMKVFRFDQFMIGNEKKHRNEQKDFLNHYTSLVSNWEDFETIVKNDFLVM